MKKSITATTEDLWSCKKDLALKGKWAAPMDSDQALRLQRYLIKGGLKRDKNDKSMLKSSCIMASYSLGKEMFVLHVNQ